MLLLFRCWGGIITWHKKMRVLLFVFTDCLEANMNNCMANDVLLHAKNDFHRLTENKFQLFLVNNVRRIISQISNNIITDLYYVFSSKICCLFQMPFFYSYYSNFIIKCQRKHYSSYPPFWWKNNPDAIYSK